MELFVSVHGLLFTMTTHTPTFFAPDRLNEHHAARKTAWRPLVISALMHILGVGLVVMLSQLNIDNQKARQKVAMPTPEINARLYYPPEPQRVNKAMPPDATEMKNALAISENAETPTILPETPYKPDTSVISKEPELKIEAQPERLSQEKKKAESESALDILEQPKVSASPTLSTDVNRRAGSLNLSVKDGAAQYFRDYHNNQISEDAERAAAAFQQSKNSPELKGPSTLQREAIKNKRPSKRVDCSGTANKTLAILSGLTGGTLECTKMGDHNRFIDARVNKLPVEETQN